jgi:soluble lytic murein transglycosylase-like protein
MTVWSLEQVLTRIQELSPPSAPSTPPAATSFASVLGQATAAAAPAATPTATPTTPSSLDGAISDAGARYGVDPNLLRALIAQESGFDPNATSAAGAQGLTQLMPSTAASLGVTNPYDPVQSIDGGAQYLRTQLDRFGGDVSKALAAYNAGPGAVERFGGVPPYAETQRYVQQVLGRYQAYRGQVAA